MSFIDDAKARFGLTYEQRHILNKLARDLTRTATYYMDEDHQDQALLHLVRISMCLASETYLPGAEWHIDALIAHLLGLLPEEVRSRIGERLASIREQGMEAVACPR